ncbi:MAG: NAD(P)/FAD-dependent oxidoreductase [Betaproteobacteria bacterium]|nr:NAD(P)/FAD-dependent oxidoreductase [Betaproteobacteria bacterium]
MTIEHFGVLIIGAGLSGIGAGVHLQKHSPGRTYAILEGRDRMGGTWDLFRYPGVRSDSDMYTLGYSFKPWEEAKAIADGPSILKYVKDTARDYGVEKRIRYNHQVKRAAWSSADACWMVEAERGDAKALVQITCNFLFLCGGYYKYSEGYTPEFPGIERFKGRIVHPQKWSDDIDYAGKKVLVIGSGATAVTLLPEMAKTAAHVTMLQRSPTYVVARPSEDAMSNWLRRHLPAMFAYVISRWKRVLLQMYFYNLCQRNPDKVKALILGGVRAYLGPDFDVDRHFTPRYKPWNQRMCLVPDGDLFFAIRKKKASVVTDLIETFTERGVKLASGDEREADLIVTATGLNLEVLNGLEISVDGKRIEPARLMSYKTLMYSGVPNLASSLGYTNASWTLKCDLTCEYVCRLLNHMQKHGYAQCVPRQNDPTVTEQPWNDFSSGYIVRSRDKFPKQGSKAPWKLRQNYARDLMSLRFGRIDDGVMEFSNLPAAKVARRV